MQELEKKVLDLAAKVYDESATPDEREEFFKLLKELIGEIKGELDEAKKE